MTITSTPTRPRGRGFASLSPERMRAIARAGGKRAHELGKAHVWTQEEARAAGRKGGKMSRRGPKKDEPLRQSTEQLV